MVVNKHKGGVGAYIGRPGPFGNPFIIGHHGDREEVVQRFKEWIYKPEQLTLRNKMRRELRGKDLVCFCAPLPCHGEVIELLVETPEEV